MQALQAGSYVGLQTNAFIYLFLFFNKTQPIISF